jgi:hypothetical protein
MDAAHLLHSISLHFYNLVHLKDLNVNDKHKI